MAGSRCIRAETEWDHHGALAATAIIVNVCVRNAIASLSSAQWRPVNHEMSWQTEEPASLAWAATAHELRAINASTETRQSADDTTTTSIGLLFTGRRAPLTGRRLTNRRADAPRRSNDTIDSDRLLLHYPRPPLTYGHADAVWKFNVRSNENRPVACRLICLAELKQKINELKELGNERWKQKIRNPQRQSGGLDQLMIKVS